MTPVEDIDGCWFWILKGLNKVIERANADWTPADVYLALKQKRAFLYTLGQDDGFLVAQLLQDQRGPYLFVWVIYGSLFHIRQQVMQAVRDLAISCGAKRIEMKSPRRWEAFKLGWKKRYTVYEADIWPPSS